MSISKPQVLDELRRVKGPDLEGNIVDLGLVSEILVKDDRVYFETGKNTSDPPKCNNDNSFPLVAFKCQAGIDGMENAGYYVADRAAQWRSNKWQGINGKTGDSVWVECKSDAGKHGNGVNTSKLWAADGSKKGPWSADPDDAIGWNQNGANQGYVFFSGNYINWLNNGSTITQTRLEIVQQVAKQTINSLAVDDAVTAGPTPGEVWR